MTASQDKATLRRRMKAVRAALTGDAQRIAANALCCHGAELATDHHVIAGYFPLRDELDPRPLLAALRANGAAIALPVMTGADQPLTFRHWDDGAPLTRATFGVMEPGPDAPLVAPDLILAPLLAVDRQGGRLGYGGGFYDRTIAQLRAAGRNVSVIGLAYQTQVVEKVPGDERDQRLDAVMTPDGLIKTR